MLRFEELPKVNSDRWLSLEDLPGEIWKKVPGYEKLLMVSNYSRVLDIAKQKIIWQTIGNDNYKCISIKNNGKYKRLLVHRLVIQAFLPNPENKPCTDHIDANRLNNTLENLKWATSKENANNPYTKLNRKEAHRNTIFSDKRVAKLDKEGNLIQIYNSVKDAAIDNNLAKCSISNAAHGRMMPNKYGQYFQCKTAGGYRWQYI